MQLDLLSTRDARNSSSGQGSSSKWRQQQQQQRGQPHVAAGWIQRPGRRADVGPVGRPARPAAAGACHTQGCHGSSLLQESGRQSQPVGPVSGHPCGAAPMCCSSQAHHAAAAWRGAGLPWPSTPTQCPRQSACTSPDNLLNNCCICARCPIIAGGQASAYPCCCCWRSLAACSVSTGAPSWQRCLWRLPCGLAPPGWPAWPGTGTGHAAPSSWRAAAWPARRCHGWQSSLLQQRTTGVVGPRCVWMGRAC